MSEYCTLRNLLEDYDDNTKKLWSIIRDSRCWGSSEIDKDLLNVYLGRQETSCSFFIPSAARIKDLKKAIREVADKGDSGLKALDEVYDELSYCVAEDFDPSKPPDKIKLGGSGNKKQLEVPLTKTTVNGLKYTQIDALVGKGPTKRVNVYQLVGDKKIDGKGDCGCSGSGEMLDEDTREDVFHQILYSYSAWRGFGENPLKTGAEMLVSVLPEDSQNEKNLKLVQATITPDNYLFWIIVILKTNLFVLPDLTAIRDGFEGKASGQFAMSRSRDPIDIGSLEQVPAKLKAFAESLGWTEDPKLGVCLLELDFRVAKDYNELQKAPNSERNTDKWCEKFEELINTTLDNLKDRRSHISNVIGQGQRLKAYGLPIPKATTFGAGLDVRGCIEHINSPMAIKH